MFAALSIIDENLNSKVFIDQRGIVLYCSAIRRFPVEPILRVYTRGLQCFKLNGNQTENDRYLEKNNFLLLAKCLKMYNFFSHLHFKIAKSAIMTQNFFS